MSKQGVSTVTKPRWFAWAAHLHLGEAAGELVYFLLTLAPVAGLAWSLLLRLVKGDAGRLIPARSWRLLGQSVGLALGVAGLAAVLGLGVALWLATGRGKWPQALRRAVIAPLLIPPYIYALTWLALLARRGWVNRGLESLLGITVSAYGFHTTILILGLVFSPIVTLITLAALDAVDPQLVEMARTLAPDRRTWTGVLLPLILPALLAGMGLVVALTLVEYGVPALLEFNVYTMGIYADFSQHGDPVQAMGAALPLFLPAVLLISLTQAAWRQTPLRARPGGSPVLSSLSRPRLMQCWIGASAIFLILGVLAPLAVLCWQSQGLPSTWQAVSAARQDLLNSLILALGSAILGTLIALPSARRLARGAPHWLWALYALPLTVPAPLFGVGLIHLWNRPLAPGIYGGPAMLVLAHMGRFLPFAVLALVTQGRQVDPALHEAARLHDVGRLRRAVQVHLPLMGPGLLAAGTVVLVLSLGELGASLLVVPPGTATLSLRLFNLLHYGASASVAGLALLVLLLVGLIGGLVLYLTHRRYA